MKIFVTVGAQMPFDRLITAMDEWAAAHPEHSVFAQIGKSELRPKHMEWSKLTSPSRFEAYCEDSDAIVGHAGIGTLFAALERGKPIVVLPRLATKLETRNEHQSATARRFAQYSNVQVAWSESEITERLSELPAMIQSAGGRVIDDAAHGPLIQALADFIDA
ncbi:MAG: UDP-N-acetylglucosamine transferase subunit ALG13 [Polyangiales bacterium]|jgi:UDP-N-acetylglucosamine transferase subunit ALG13